MFFVSFEFFSEFAYIFENTGKLVKFAITRDKFLSVLWNFVTKTNPKFVSSRWFFKLKKDFKNAKNFFQIHIDSENQWIRLKWKRKEKVTSDYLLDNILSINVNNFSALLLYKINALVIFNLDDFVLDFCYSRSPDILINF